MSLENSKSLNCRLLQNQNYDKCFLILGDKNQGTGAIRTKQNQLQHDKQQCTMSGNILGFSNNVRSLIWLHPMQHTHALLISGQLYSPYLDGHGMVENLQNAEILCCHWSALLSRASLGLSSWCQSSTSLNNTFSSGHSAANEALLNQHPFLSS